MKFASEKSLKLSKSGASSRFTSKSSMSTIKASKFNKDHSESSFESLIQANPVEEIADSYCSLKTSQVTLEAKENNLNSNKLERSESDISLKLNTAQNYISQLEQENQSLSFRVQSLLNHQSSKENDFSSDLGDLLHTNISKIQSLQQRLQNVLQVCQKLDSERNDYLIKLTSQDKLVKHLRSTNSKLEKENSDLFEYKSAHEEGSIKFIKRTSSLEERIKELNHKLGVQENLSHLNQLENKELQRYKRMVEDYAQQYYTTNNRILDELEKAEWNKHLTLPSLEESATLDVSIQLGNCLSVLNFIESLCKSYDKLHIENSNNYSKLSNTENQLQDVIQQNFQLNDLNINLCKNFDIFTKKLDGISYQQQDLSHINSKYEKLLKDMLEPYKTQLEECKQSLETSKAEFLESLKSEQLKNEILTNKNQELQTLFDKSENQLKDREHTIKIKEIELNQKEKDCNEQSKYLKKGITRLNRKLKDLHLETLDIEELSDHLPPLLFSKASLLNQVQDMKNRV
eukprot:NODE_341_length_9178_cov_1.080846.p1 type:complete len:516 gc:universal NODE_341_length_9178_cov_1.080846:5481-3934(-)